MNPQTAPPSPRHRASSATAGGFANGFEMVGIVLVFFFVGFGLDRWLDTTPWFMVGLTVVGIVGTFVRTWYAYSAEMDRLAAQRTPPPAPTGEEPGA